ncbi:unnamed protein product [Lactuca saligna]|uniref:Uncharacterized protein n=1 Tax=Lactuca saligna TaxID=75948 RepID=A0AA36ELA5_LACSI|nr:unnamed protein product [Lactuca saligna]
MELMEKNETTDIIEFSVSGKKKIFASKATRKPKEDLFAIALLLFHFFSVVALSSIRKAKTLFPNLNQDLQIVKEDVIEALEALREVSEAIDDSNVVLCAIGFRVLRTYWVHEISLGPHLNLKTYVSKTEEFILSLVNRLASLKPSQVLSTTLDFQACGRIKEAISNLPRATKDANIEEDAALTRDSEMVES